MKYSPRLVLACAIFVSAGILASIREACALPRPPSIEPWAERLAAKKSEARYASLQQGTAAAMQSKHEEAIKSFEAVLRKRPSNSDALFLLALSQEALGNPERSLQSLDEALWFSKFSLFTPEEVSSEKARLLAAQGQNGKAVTLATQVLAKQPESLRARCVLSSALLAQGNRGDALRVLRETPAAQRDDHMVKYSLAQALLSGAHRSLNKADIAEAADILNALAASTSGSLDLKEVAATRIQALFAAGQLEAAGAAIRSAQKRYPDAAEFSALEKQLRIEQGALAPPSAGS